MVEISGRAIAGSSVDTMVTWKTATPVTVAEITGCERRFWV
ncbi:hypothetical protein [Paenibacillus taihuensis]|nr:hypothetical protein [Paenibacillus taihuensis]